MKSQHSDRNSADPAERNGGNILSMVREIISQLHDPSYQIENDSLLENYEEETIFDVLQQLYNDKSVDLIQFISAIFIGSQQISNSAVRRFGRVFHESIEILKDARLLSPSQRTQLMELLFSNMRNLSKEQAQQSADKIIAELSRQQPSTQFHFTTLELLPQLATLAGEKCRDYAIERLCGTTWPSHSIVLFASTLVELNSSHTKDLDVIQKISSYITLHGTQGSRDTQEIPIEDLPSLIYQLTSIASDSTPSIVRRTVLETVADSLDHIFEKVIQTETSLSTRATLIKQVMSTIVHHLALLISKDQSISAEVIRVVKTRQLLKFRNWHRQSRLLSPSRLLLSLLAAKSPRNSSTLILELVETINEICQAETLLRDDTISGTSCHLWFDDDVWSSTIEIRPENLIVIFTQTIEGPFMSSEIAAPLLSIALNLLEKKLNGKKFFGSGFSNLSSHTLSMTSASISPPTGLLLAQETPGPGPGIGSAGGSTGAGDRGPGRGGNIHSSISGSITSQYFGAWILFKLFVHCPYLRIQIARELTMRLQQHQTLETPEDVKFQSLQDQLIVLIFQSLTTCCLDGLMEITSELQETFLILTFLHPHTASDLIRVLYPLFSVSPSLGDRCALALRKASFSKDISSRQTAVCSLTTLLRCQLQSSSYSSRNQLPFSSSQPDRIVEVETVMVMSQHEHLTQRLSIGISVDEVLSLCRRFLQHQSSVKSVLYNNLALLHFEFLHFRSLIAQLFRNHLLHLLVDEDFMGVLPLDEEDNDFVFGAGTRGMLILNVDRCVDSSGNPLENISDLIIHSIALSKVEKQNPLNDGGDHSPSETTELIKIIWRFFRGLAQADLSIPQNPSTPLEYGRLIFVIEALQTAISCLWTIPDHVSRGLTFSTRINLFLMLIDRLENFTCRAIKYRKQMKDKDKDKEKDKDKGNTSESQFNSDLSLPRLPSESFHRIIRPVVGVDRCSTNSIELEAEFLSKCLDLLQLENETIELTEEEDQLRQKLLSSPSIEFLRRHLRERYIRVLEAILQYSEDLAIRKSLPQLFPSSPPVDSINMTSLTGVRETFRRLYSPILLDLMMMRTLDLEQVKSNPKMQPSLLFSFTSVSSYLSCKQLALRGMLGCIRLEIFLGKMLSKSTRSREMCLIDLLERGANQASSSLSNNVPTNPRSLDFHARKFITLFVNLHESDRADASLAVFILGEISMLLNTEQTRIVQELIIQQCKDKLISPSVLLSQSLIQLLILRLPQSPTSRFEAVVNIANMIQTCCQSTADLLENDANNYNDDDSETRSRKKTKKLSDNIKDRTYTFVSYNTIAGSTTTLVNLLEKVCGLLTTLMKLESKSKGHVNQSDTLSLYDNVEPDVSPEKDYLILNLCPALQECMSAVVKIQKFEESVACTVAIISLLNKLYKIQVAITKDIFMSISKKIITSSHVLSSAFREMTQHIADNVTPIVQKNLSQIHNSLDSAGSGQPNKKSSLSKLSKLIPDLIYQMECVDVALIKLHGVVKDREKTIVGRWIKRTTSRDFKWKPQLIEVEQMRAREKVEAKLNRKRNAEMKKTSTTVQGKKKKRKGEEESYVTDMSEDSMQQMMAATEHSEGEGVVERE